MILTTESAKPRCPISSCIAQEADKIHGIRVRVRGGYLEAVLLGAGSSCPVVLDHEGQMLPSNRTCSEEVHSLQHTHARRSVNSEWHIEDSFHIGAALSRSNPCDHMYIRRCDQHSCTATESSKLFLTVHTQARRQDTNLQHLRQSDTESVVLLCFV